MLDNKYFIVNFLRNDKVFWELVYELYDNSLTKIFLEVLDRTNGMQVPVWHTNIAYSKEEIVNKWIEMWQLSQTIQTVDAYKDRVKFDIETDVYSQALLNHLHQFVEEFEVFDHQGILSDADKILLGPAISRFNDLIHYFENDSLFEDGWIGFRIEKENKIPMTEEHIALGQTDYIKDRLYLGYGEVGKMLRHMFINNDIDGITRDQSNEKANVTSEVFIPFETITFSYDDYENWCLEHQPDTSQHKSYDHPTQWAVWEIGKLVKENGKKGPYEQIKIGLSNTP